MTTTVRVFAHCDPTTTKVEVVLTEGCVAVENVTLMDGEETSFAIFDNRRITVEESPI